ncbi:MAG TPA: hypothetical protein VK766_00670 [Cytophagaceae bacterium]|jgi:hypothetical protein|nr:hypothetical protein [Cytophagaceae bacterium]
MKEFIISLAFIVSLVSFATAQDIIVKRNGEEIKAKVKSVFDREIEYLRFDNIDGPMYKISKSDVLLIMYSNGSKDIFTDEAGSNNTNNRNNQESIINRPAQRYYNVDFFNPNVPIVFLGVDFSRCKLTGNNFYEPKRLFADINTLFITEKKKYDVATAIHRSILPEQFSIVNQRNESVMENMLSQNSGPAITFSDLQSIIDSYDMESANIRDGLAFVIICDHLNEIRVDAAYYYVAFDVASKKIILSDRIIGRAGGSGQRNYWARSLYETISLVHSRDYSKWKTFSKR